ncbi:YvcK family protein [Rhizobium leguminosarum]|uniref:gluconeogenesis factor YvcK family protein n=1 Tax=Rhizobium leguminosarum TaxID=384 RepID=UPI001C969200|nr:gluconeogenesis factor YvcK family protein [Rhizobium leguminosarum]MBY5918549.1 YvcK family protein [Rhizobium leguminosarum]
MKRIVLFSGGSACRSINVALCQSGADVTRVVPAWDSGGSSKVIRERLSILSVGDIRQALMTMAHGEGCAGDVVKICNARVSANLGFDDARKEFLFYAEGRHPLLERMEPGLRGAILNYLNTFATSVGRDFDFRHGSVGNFILTGACVAHNGDVNTAIFVFRKLCGIGGNVWPSSCDNDLVLSATLRDGRRLAPQDVITSMGAEDATVGIAEVELAGADQALPVANSAVLDAVARADLIAIGPGSLYTSILPHLLVTGLVSAIERANCPKVFIGNILQCRETMGLTLEDVLAAADLHARKGGGGTSNLFTFVLANRMLFPFEKTVGTFPYLRENPQEKNGRHIIKGEFEDAWSRGQHDGDATAAALLKIASGDASDA